MVMPNIRTTGLGASELLEKLDELQAFRRARRRERWRDRGVERTHLEVLMVLGEQGALSMHALATAVGSSPAALTGVVDRMEARALVSRSADPSDRRSIRVALAEAGEEALNEIDLVRRNSVLALLDAMTDDELDAVTAGLAALAAASERASSERASSEHPLAAGQGMGAFGAKGLWRLALGAAEAAGRDRRRECAGREGTGS